MVEVTEYSTGFWEVWTPTGDCWNKVADITPQTVNYTNCPEVLKPLVTEGERRVRIGDVGNETVSGKRTFSVEVELWLAKKLK